MGDAQKERMGMGERRNGNYGLSSDFFAETTFFYNLATIFWSPFHSLAAFIFKSPQVAPYF
jgi:hypothetical protein